MTINFQETLNLLSSMYLCKPTKEAVCNWRALLSGDVPDSMLHLKDAVNKIDPNSEQELEDLLWEYTRLFIGPYKLPCPPWESVYTSSKRLIMQEAHDEVQSFYNEVGLKINNLTIMPDHIGVEQNFLAVLLQKMNDEPEKRPHYMDIGKRFLNDHLTRWIQPFAQDMERAADSLFYKTLARTTRVLIMEECGYYFCLSF